MSLSQQGLVFLAATVIAVPLFKRLGLGSVLGYLTAGAVIGPWGVKLISHPESVLHVAELGVVMLLFLIGLELQPSRLWELRKTVFGVGSAQVLGTGALLALVPMASGLGWRPSLIAGIGLALSSTAIALQLLSEKNDLATQHGRTAFGILLFQDLAVIPLLALLPLLGDGGARSTEPGWLATLKIACVLVAVVVVGRFVIRPVFRIVASMQSQELFTATSLLVVLGTAALVSKVGMSMALGAFLAGVLLADSEYRHELEADIEPFKGLLLGLFFIAVGMSCNLGLVVSRPLLVIGLTVGLVALKIAAIFVIGKFTLKGTEPSLSLGLSISQGGEFAFVLFGMAVHFHVLEPRLSELLIVVVSLSMATTPGLLILHDRVIRPRLAQKDRRDFDVAPEEDTPVIIAGFGRVGQMVGRILSAKRIPFTALDSSPEHIDFIKRFGNKVFYGDAARLDLLRAARADKAKVFVLAIDDVEASMHTAETVMQHFPHLTILARARNRQHAYRLLDLGITHVVRETFASSLELTVDVLESLGYDYGDARASATAFREHDEQLLMATLPFFQKDEGKLVEMTKQARAELESIFEGDAAKRKPAA